MKLYVLGGHNNSKIIMKTKELFITEVRTVVNPGLQQGVVTRMDGGMF